MLHFLTDMVYAERGSVNVVFKLLSVNVPHFCHAQVRVETVGLTKDTRAVSRRQGELLVVKAVPEQIVPITPAWEAAVQESTRFRAPSLTRLGGGKHVIAVPRVLQRI